jgi:hypothetical protein
MKKDHDLIDIEYDGKPYEVEYLIIPEEPMVMYYADGTGHPGSDAEFHVINVKPPCPDLTDEQIMDLIIEKLDSFEKRWEIFYI